MATYYPLYGRLYSLYRNETAAVDMGIVFLSIN
jgi:hypothetical protein